MCSTLIFFLMSIIAPEPVHAFYLSVIEIYHAEESGAAKMQVKVFSDDLYTALYNQGHDEITSDYPKLYEQHPEEIQAYFREHIILKINSEPLPITISGSSVEGNAHWFSVPLNTPQNWSSLNLHADYFMEVYPTQSQMVHIKYNGISKTLRLTRKKPAAFIEF